MTAADFQPLIQAAFALSGTVLAALIAIYVPIYVPKAIAAFEKRTGIQLSDQQRAAVQDAVATEAGIVETKLQQGTLQLAQVTPTNPAMLEHAQAVLARVPDSANGQGTTAAAIAAMIVGKADTTPKPTPILLAPQTATAGTKP